MKKVLIIIVAVIALSSCTKDGVDSDAKGMHTTNAIEKFAKILSMAVSENEQLRAFIKEEAIKQFDCDYDVFYPYAKDIDVEKGKTFRDILIEYSSESEIEQIESDAELLTIMVPNWTWLGIDGFCAENWDVSNKLIGVGFEEKSDTRTVFSNGKVFDNISVGELPSYPIIIVKNNERLRVSQRGTKGAPVKYEFCSTAFDGAQHPSTKSTTYTRELGYDGLGECDDAPAGDINSLCLGAYEEFGTSWGNALQRDYIYFGMTRDSMTNGALNTNIVEKLYRFRVNPALYGTIKTTNDGDPSFKTGKDINGQSAGNAFLNDRERVMKSMWEDGAFEFQFHFFCGPVESASTVADSLTISVPPYKLWYLSKTTITRSVYHITDFKYHFAFNRSDLHPRWYYLNGDGFYIQNWDISTSSYYYYIRAEEWDASNTYEYETTTTCTYSHNFAWNVGGEITFTLPIGEENKLPIKLSLGINGSNNNSTTEVKTVKYKIHTGSYNIGTRYLDFRRNVINGGPVWRDGEEYYTLTNVAFGDLDMTFLPSDVRTLE